MPYYCSSIWAWLIPRRHATWSCSYSCTRVALATAAAAAPYAYACRRLACRHCHDVNTATDTGTATTETFSRMSWLDCRQSANLGLRATGLVIAGGGYRPRVHMSRCLTVPVVHCHWQEKKTICNWGEMPRGVADGDSSASIELHRAARTAELMSTLALAAVHGPQECHCPRGPLALRDHVHAVPVATRPSTSRDRRRDYGEKHSIAQSLWQNSNEFNKQVTRLGL